MTVRAVWVRLWDSVVSDDIAVVLVLPLPVGEPPADFPEGLSGACLRDVFLLVLPGSSKVCWDTAVSCRRETDELEPVCGMR